VNGGDMRVRTADPLLAKQVLYQLSYIPKDQELIINNSKAAQDKNANQIVKIFCQKSR